MPFLSAQGTALYKLILRLSKSVRAQFFDVVDADHSGEIDVHELQRALALGDLNFSLSIVAHMIR